MSSKVVPEIRVVTLDEKSLTKKGEWSSCECVCISEPPPPPPCACHKFGIDEIGGKESPRTFFRLTGNRHQIE